jgi:hypothetical protein
MKPVIIIAIAVVCSIITTIGVLAIFFTSYDSVLLVDHTLWALLASWIAVAVAIIFSIISNKKATEALRQNEKVGNNALMAELLDRFTQILDKEITIEKLLPEKEDSGILFDRYASDYLNHIDRLLYIKDKEMINEDIFDFFKNFIKYGKQHLEWKTKKHGEKYVKEGWEVARDYLNKISSDERRLPKSMWSHFEFFKEIDEKESK